MKIYLNLLILTTICCNLHSMEEMKPNDDMKKTTITTQQAEETNNLNNDMVEKRNNTLNQSLNVSKINFRDNSTFEHNSNNLLNKNMLNNTVIEVSNKPNLDSNGSENIINEANINLNNINFNIVNNDISSNTDLKSINNNIINNQNIDEYYTLNGLIDVIDHLDNTTDNLANCRISCDNDPKHKCNIVESIVRYMINNSSLPEKFESIQCFLFNVDGGTVINGGRWKSKYNRVFTPFVNINLNLITLFKIFSNGDVYLKNITKELEQYFYSTIDEIFSDILRDTLYNKKYINYFFKHGLKSTIKEIKWVPPEIIRRLCEQQIQDLKNLNWKLCDEDYSIQFRNNVTTLSVITGLKEGIYIFNKFLEFLNKIRAQIEENDISNKYKFILDFMDILCKSIDPNCKDKKYNSQVFYVNDNNLDSFSVGLLQNLKSIVKNSEQEMLNNFIFIALELIKNKTYNNIDAANNNFAGELYDKLTKFYHVIIYNIMEEVLNKSNNYNINPKITNIDIIYDIIQGINIFRNKENNAKDFNTLLNNIKKEKEIRFLQFLHACIDQIVIINKKFNADDNNLREQLNNGQKQLEEEKNKLEEEQNKIKTNIEIVGTNNNNKDIKDNMPKVEVSISKKKVDKNIKAIKINIKKINLCIKQITTQIEQTRNYWYNILINFCNKLKQILSPIKQNYNKSSSMNLLQLVNSRLETLCSDLLNKINTNNISKQGRDSCLSYLIGNMKNMQDIYKNFMIHTYEDIISNLQGEEKEQAIILGIKNEDGTLITFEDYINEIINNIKNIVHSIKDEYLKQVINIIFGYNINNSNSTEVRSILKRYLTEDLQQLIMDPSKSMEDINTQIIKNLYKNIINTISTKLVVRVTQDMLPRQKELSDKVKKDLNASIKQIFGQYILLDQIII